MHKLLIFIPLHFTFTKFVSIFIVRMFSLYYRFNPIYCGIHLCIGCGYILIGAANITTALAVMLGKGVTCTNLEEAICDRILENLPFVHIYLVV